MAARNVVEGETVLLQKTDDLSRLTAGSFGIVVDYCELLLRIRVHNGGMAASQNQS